MYADYETLLDWERTPYSIDTGSYMVTAYLGPMTGTRGYSYRVTADTGGALLQVSAHSSEGEVESSSHHPSKAAAKAAAERDAAGRQWTYREAADALGVSVRTLYTYRRDGRFPAPDGQVGATPWWSPATVCDWQESRPGQGVGGGRPRRSED